MALRYRSIYLLILIAFGVSGWSQSVQTQNVNLSDSIKFYSQDLIRNHDLELREKSFDFLNQNLGTFLMEFSDFQDSFPHFEGLAVLEKMDINLRIVSYQLYRDTSTYEYGGWVQANLLNTPLFLNDASELWEDDQDLDYMTLDTDNWYGALYYQMFPVTVSNDAMTVLLFGLDNYHFFTKRKVMETLVVDRNGIHFGQSMIEMEEGLPQEYWKKRFILDYSVQAPATLRYDLDREKIIFDHLIFMESDILQQKIMRVPDGTYSGFEFSKKDLKLTFIEKVFDQVLDEAPGGREKPEVKRDLFGNPDKK